VLDGETNFPEIQTIFPWFNTQISLIQYQEPQLILGQKEHCKYVSVLANIDLNIELEPIS
jgi:hypothetical protein